MNLKNLWTISILYFFHFEASLLNDIVLDNFWFIFSLLLTDLTSAKVFFWRFLVKYIKEKSDESPDNINLLDLWDRIMPSLSDLAKFVSK